MVRRRIAGSGWPGSPRGRAPGSRAEQGPARPMAGPATRSSTRSRSGGRHGPAPGVIALQNAAAHPRPAALCSASSRRGTTRCSSHLTACRRAGRCGTWRHRHDPRDPTTNGAWSSPSRAFVFHQTSAAYAALAARDAIRTAASSPLEYAALLTAERDSARHDERSACLRRACSSGSPPQIGCSTLVRGSASPSATAHVFDWALGDIAGPSAQSFAEIDVEAAGECAALDSAGPSSEHGRSRRRRQYDATS